MISAGTAWVVPTRCLAPVHASASQSERLSTERERQHGSDCECYLNIPRGVAQTPQDVHHIPIATASAAMAYMRGMGSPQ